MLPDGTYCLAPPPPGIDVATYYSTLPAGVTVSSSPGVTTTVPPPPGTTPPPPPTTAESSSGVTSTTTTTRYVCATFSQHDGCCGAPVLLTWGELGLHTYGCHYVLSPHTWTRSFGKAETEGLKVQGHPDLYHESVSSTGNACLKRRKVQSQLDNPYSCSIPVFLALRRIKKGHL